MENKIQLFEGVKVRYAWDEENEDWLFSAVDVCNVLAESASKDPGAYWRKLKQRLTKEGSEVVTNCHGLKLTSSDGKKYLTDCFNTADTLRLIQSIPSKKAEPFDCKRRRRCCRQCQKGYRTAYRPYGNIRA